MDQFPSNSHTVRRSDVPVTPSAEPAADPQNVVLDKVVTGRVIRRKRSILSRVTETLFQGESSVFGYLLQEVLVPALKDMATSMVTQGIEKALYGDVRTPRAGRGYGGPASRTHVQYDRPAAARHPGVTPTARRAQQRPATMINDVIVATKVEAQDIIDKMYQTVQMYQQATVGHLNNLLGEPSVYTDHSYGWTNLDDLTAKQVSGGYLLLFPPVEPL